jgi:hypothetical protein
MDVVVAHFKSRPGHFIGLIGKKTTQVFLSDMLCPSVHVNWLSLELLPSKITSLVTVIKTSVAVYDMSLSKYASLMLSSFHHQ